MRSLRRRPHGTTDLRIVYRRPESRAERLERIAKQRLLAARGLADWPRPWVRPVALTAWSLLLIMLTLSASRLVVSGGVRGGPVYQARSTGNFTCDLNANSAATLATQVTAATTGQTICLATANYGNWTGTNKAITVRAAPSASPQMTISFGSGDSGFTLDSMTGMSGDISGGTNITIKNSTFADSLDVDDSNGPGTISGLVIDGNNFDWMQGPTAVGSDTPAKLIVFFTTGTTAGDAVIVRNNTFRNGDIDGIQYGGAGVLVQNNTFTNLCDFNGSSPETNHTDNMQFNEGSNTRVVGNFMQTARIDPNDGKVCNSQGIAAFDGGTVGVVVEDNVVDIGRPWGIEFYADNSSIIRHNTVPYRTPANCGGWNATCGGILMDHKAGDPAGSGTHAYDNVATGVGFNNGSTGTVDHNMCHDSGCTGTGTITATPTYVGGSSPTTYAGFCLAAGSAGKGAASDGLDIGIRC